MYTICSVVVLNSRMPGLALNTDSPSTSSHLTLTFFCERHLPLPQPPNLHLSSDCYDPLQCRLSIHTGRDALERNDC